MLVGIALYTKIIVDKALEHEKIIYEGITFLGLALILVIVRLIYMLCKNKLSLEIDVNLKREIYSELLNKDINSLVSYHSGEYSNIYLNDVRNINDYYTSILPNLWSQLSKLVFAFIALVYFSYELVGILIVASLIALILGRYYTKKLKLKNRKALESDGKINSFMQEGMENIRVVKAFNIKDNLLNSLSVKQQENYKIKYSRNILSIIGGIGIYALMNVGYVFAIVFCCYLISKDKMGYGTFMAIIQLVTYFESPFASLSTFLSNRATFNASRERIDGIFDMTDEDPLAACGTLKEIIFDNVSFSYDKQIYDSFSYTINARDIVCLKGPSGAGKTTLLYLMLGFIKPQAGKIIIRTTNGDFEAGSSTRCLFSYVPQENILFSGTILENIELFCGKTAREKIDEALKLAMIYDDIMSMPNGLDTRLNERGTGISVGQIQRILIAISLIKDKEIMLLDEFTSSLDRENEAKIIENIKKLNKTVIMISHRDVNMDGVKLINIKGDE